MFFANRAFRTDDSYNMLSPIDATKNLKFFSLYPFTPQQKAQTSAMVGKIDFFTI
jgi:hypothetical protein